MKLPQLVAGAHQLAVRRKGERLALAPVSVDPQLLGSVLRVPKTDRPVGGGSGQQLAARDECDRQHLLVVSIEHSERASRARLKQPDLAAEAPDGERQG